MEFVLHSISDYMVSTSVATDSDWDNIKLHDKSLDRSLEIVYSLLICSNFCRVLV